MMFELGGILRMPRSQIHLYMFTTLRSVAYPKLLRNNPSLEFVYVHHNLFEDANICLVIFFFDKP